MLCVVAAALWFGRITSVSHVLCTALGVVILLDPWAVLAPGFWLSFGAVAMILYAGTGRVGPSAPGLWATLRLAAHTQYVVTVGLVPLTMLLFSQFSLASPIANALAIPLISLVVTPLSLVGSMLLGATGDACAEHRPRRGCVPGRRACVDERLAAGGVECTRAPALGLLLCRGLGTVWMLAPRGWPRRWLGAVAWFPLLA
ncbi:ComEC/Rec2 family competence protein [Massilia sp. H-1]|nr:ComEC/Rec2 family competence protein [Massilia sp. H-1]